MLIAFITRSTLYSVSGGDSIQVMQTARHLRMLGIGVDIRLTTDEIDYSRYDLLHFFNIIRPADMLYHIRRSGKPYVVSTLLIDYSAYDKHHRGGLSGFACRFLTSNGIEYLKTIARYLLGRDSLRSKDYVWKGQQRCVEEILTKAAYIFPNSELEYQDLVRQYRIASGWQAVPNGLDAQLFRFDGRMKKDERLVLCVGRIEGIKNQLNLIRALNDTRYKLVLIGAAAPNQRAYYQECRRIASNNILFLGHLPQEELVPYYQRAKVHILPSWFEICGLSSLEAGAMGCNIVITDKGYTRAYYGNEAFYCDPGNPVSIRAAVDRAARSECAGALRRRIEKDYTWSRAASAIAHGYEEVFKHDEL